MYLYTCAWILFKKKSDMEGAAEECENLSLQCTLSVNIIVERVEFSQKDIFPDCLNLPWWRRYSDRLIWCI